MVWWVGLRMSSVPKPGWSSECLCQISAFYAGLKVDENFVVVVVERVTTISNSNASCFRVALS